MLVSRNGFNVGERLRLPDHEGDFEVIEIQGAMMRIAPVVPRKRLGLIALGACGIVVLAWLFRF